jgi:hypothetical protein
MIGKRTLGSPLREICTMGSERGDEFKRLRPVGEGTGSKESDYSEAPQRATTSRLVPTHQGVAASSKSTILTKEAAAIAGLYGADIWLHNKSGSGASRGIG